MHVYNACMLIILGNFTTNLAESYMSVRAKFDGGKQINRSQSGSWQGRCVRDQCGDLLLGRKLYQLLLRLLQGLLSQNNTSQLKIEKENPQMTKESSTGGVYTRERSLFQA